MNPKRHGLKATVLIDSFGESMRGWTLLQKSDLVWLKKKVGRSFPTNLYNLWGC